MAPEIILNVATIATAIGVWFTYNQSKTNQKQLHLATLNRCISEFRGYSNLKDEACPDKDLFNYIDLVNEELFYFKHDYLPKEVAAEWIDGMIDFMPLTDRFEKVLNQGNCINKLSSQHGFYFKNFPRVKSSFAVPDNYDFQVTYSDDLNKRELRVLTRRKIVEDIYNNLKRFEF